MAASNRSPAFPRLTSATRVGHKSRSTTDPEGEITSPKSPVNINDAGATGANTDSEDNEEILEKRRSPVGMASRAALSVPRWLPWVLLMALVIYILASPEVGDQLVAKSKDGKRDDIILNSAKTTENSHNTLRSDRDSQAAASTSMHTAWRRQAYLSAPFIHPQLYTCPQRNSNGKATNEWDSRAQKGEDKFLRDEVWGQYDEKDRTARTYIELGAYNGLYLSTTYGFEHAWNWRGLLVEGHPLNSKELISNARMHRPNSAAITASICGVGQSYVPGAVHFTMKGGVTGSTLEHISPEFMKRFNHTTDNPVAVDCLPMQMLLDSTGLQDVDLFSLDVEGAELTVLQTIDFDVTNIHIILVEINSDYAAQSKLVIAFLKDHGFELFAPKVGHNNQVWRNPNYEQIRRRRLSLPLDASDPNTANTLMGRVYYEAGTAVRCAN